jgi:hypothetical protein
MKNSTAILLMLLLAAACATPPQPAPPPAPAVPSAEAIAALQEAQRIQRSLDLLASYLVGTWDSVAQPARYGYAPPTRLRFVRMWPERAGEYWFYMQYENPADESEVRRQRVLRFVRDGSTLHALTYRLPAPEAYAGEWRKEHPFASLSPASLREDEACRMLWVFMMDVAFGGGTEGSNCRGDRPEVTHERTEFEISSGSMRTSIRGMDAAGAQVDGPEGSSLFHKLPPK